MTLGRDLPLLAGAASLLIAAFSAGLGAAQPAAGDSALAAQLARGEDVYFADCVSCHNDDLSGGAMQSAPALAGDAFLARWSGRNARDLLELARTTMPQGQPRSLDDQAYLDVVAFVLARNKIALGSGALTEQGASQIALRP
jgi:mono/diheme cytochrome c family protein